jgi:hypothetical protein
MHATFPVFFYGAAIPVSQPFVAGQDDFHAQRFFALFF